MTHVIDLDRVVEDAKVAMDNHLKDYLATGGKQGHLWDTSPWGGRGLTPTLVLKVTGRKSGKPQMLPLIYAPWGDEYVIIGSKGGAKDHPYWYLNLIARPNLEFQVGGKCWHATWREAKGEERSKIWDYMVVQYPPYTDYQAHTQREIPVVLLKPGMEIPAL
jgi:deazaflavin-dependent oxidoreductase (nitroreductase family)